MTWEMASSKNKLLESVSSRKSRLPAVPTISWFMCPSTLNGKSILGLTVLVLDLMLLKMVLQGRHQGSR